MARTQRIEYEGAVYHGTARGNERRQIVRDDADREHFLRVLGESVVRFEVRLYLFCLIGLFQCLTPAAHGYNHVDPSWIGSLFLGDYVCEWSKWVEVEGGEGWNGMSYDTWSDAFKAVHEAVLDYCNPRPGHETDIVTSEGVQRVSSKDE